MSAGAIDRLSREDARILRLDRGPIRGHTCKVMVLEGSVGRPLPTIDELRAHVAARLDAVPRFRRRLHATPLRLAAPVWVDDAEFDIRRHITSVPVEQPVDRPELERIVGRLMAEPLERAHPLWHLGVVERVGGNSMALVWRVHHCMADGSTCVRIASSLFWDAPDEAAAVNAQSAWQPAAPPTAARLVASGVAARARARRRRAPRSAPRLSSLPRAERVVSRELRRDAVKTPLAARVGSERSVGFARAPLEECKRAGKAIGESVTVNDVVLAIIAGGIRARIDQGEIDGRSVRVKVPVNLHTPGDLSSNHDSFFFVDLPIAEPDVAKRVLAISRETRERKLEHDAETLYRLGLNPLVAHWAMSPRVFTFNVSNVRGPTGDVSVLGARVAELYTLAEIAQHHALRVAVISVAGYLSFGLCADKASLPDLSPVADGMREATEELLRAAV